MEGSIKIRKIRKEDNARLASIIRTSLEEFAAAKPGTVYFDKTTDHLFELFKCKNAAYFVAELQGAVTGGAGIFPTEDLPGNTCELVKMYVSSAARRKGFGKLLLERCIMEAKAFGYKMMYLETMPELTHAIEMYKKPGSILSHPH